MKNQNPGKEKQYPFFSLSIGYSSFPSSYLIIGDWVLDIGHSSSSYSYLVIGYWVLDIGHSSSSSSYLKFGYWVLDIGYSSSSLAKKHSPIHNPITNIQLPNIREAKKNSQ